VNEAGSLTFLAQRSDCDKMPGVPERLEILPLLEKIQAIARNGLTYAKDVYDRERYEKLLGLANEYTGLALDLPAQEVQERLSRELGPITPKLGADAAIFDERGRILLMLRTDNKRWCMPCGLQDVGESPEECAIREAREETSLEVKVLELVGVFTRLPRAEYTPFTLVSVVYLCEVIGGELRSSHEDLGLRYWNLEDVRAWHGDQEIQAREAYQKWLARRG
jgi:ADP-ribose pyrophosphatase YjhB (NUDIX family)